MICGTLRVFLIIYKLIWCDAIRIERAVLESTMRIHPSSASRPASHHHHHPPPCVHQRAPASTHARSGGLRYYASAQESIRAPQQLRQVPLDGVRVIQSPEALHGLLHTGPAFALTLLQEGEISGARELYAEHPAQMVLEMSESVRAHLLAPQAARAIGRRG